MTLIEGVSSTILTSGGLNLGQLVRPRLSLTLKQSKRRKTTTLLTVSPPASVVFSVRRPNETSTDDDCLGPHSVSSGFSRLLRKKTDRNPPRVMTLSVLTASLPDWRISVLMASIPSSPSERRLKQPRKLTLSVLTASISSYLFFSVRKLIETTTEIDSLGPHHGINSVFSLLLCQKTDLFNFEITSQVVNVWNFGSVFLVCILVTASLSPAVSRAPLAAPTVTRSYPKLPCALTEPNSNSGRSGCSNTSSLAHTSPHLLGLFYRTGLVSPPFTGLHAILKG
ncbi:hypothetical protein F2Q68_00027300 [Brassica cretica]|uniref:Uncharacterized protein n=1 Tax=Brassica cretica TaxID=69181 RepID=A0A8S9IJ65_BRACR|nr:hypothetical protein F2Q68_00027300 [Brassica cretica]